MYGTSPTAEQTPRKAPPGRKAARRRHTGGAGRLTAPRRRTVEAVAAEQRAWAERIGRALPAGAVRGVVRIGSLPCADAGPGVDDLTLVVVTTQLPRAVVAALVPRVRAAAARVGRAAGAHVDVRLLTPRALLRPPATLFAVELAAHHRVLVGPDDLLAGLRAPDPADLPAIEATRRLVHASVRLLETRELLGLAYDLVSGERLAATLRAATLAAGDACLIAAGRYHPSPEARADRARTGDVPRQLRTGYLEALLPEGRALPVPDPARRWGALCDAAQTLLDALREVERRRVGVDPGDRCGYRDAMLNGGPVPWRDRLRDVRELGLMGGLLPLRGSREARLLAVLPCVLRHIAAPGTHHASCTWLEPSRLIGMAPLAEAELGRTFVRRWKALQ